MGFREMLNPSYGLGVTDGERAVGINTLIALQAGQQAYFSTTWLDGRVEVPGHATSGI
jgi:hypothetical protein